VLSDKTNDADRIRTSLREKGAFANIPPKADRPVDYLRNPRNGVRRFQQSVNMVTFVLTEMLVRHRASSTGRERKPRYANILSYHNQSIHVALRV
jgi:hypothetical protein